MKVLQEGHPVKNLIFRIKSNPSEHGHVGNMDMMMTDFVCRKAIMLPLVVS